MLALITLLAGMAAKAFTANEIASALGGLSLMNWVTLGGDLVHAEPALIKALKALHPAFAEFINDIESGLSADLAAIGPFHLFQEWVRANGDAAIKANTGIAGE